MLKCERLQFEWSVFGPKSQITYFVVFTPKNAIDIDWRFTLYGEKSNDIIKMNGFDPELVELETADERKAYAERCEPVFE
jgi:hypothetical protein